MKNYLHIIILIAFLGGIIAPACGFSWSGDKFSIIEICTAQGFETRIVENDQNPDEAPEHKMADQCQFCVASANLISFLPEITELQTLNFNAEKLKFDLYETIILSRTKNNLSARGPPALI